jgi:SAM-dependent methyltransferase
MFITFRRYYIDNFLESVPFEGKVIDIGGKKINKRGRFRPPVDKVTVWEYLNIDPSTEPDYCCSAEKIPVSDNQYDWVILCEVLEYLSDSSTVIDECIRILKPGGKFVITAPFLNGIHADPNDFQRWTRAKYILELEENRDMRIGLCKEMGSIWAVYWDCMYTAGAPGGPEPYKKISRLFLRLIKDIFMYLEKKCPCNERITTGYALIAIKRTYDSNNGGKIKTP